MKNVSKLIISLSLAVTILFTNTAIAKAADNPSGTIYAYYNSLSDKDRQIYLKLYDAAKSHNESYITLRGAKEDQVENITYCLLFDHPELFWVAPSYTIGTGKKGCSVKFDYIFTKKELPECQAEFDQITAQILSHVNEYQTTREKEYYLAKTVCDLNTYADGDIMDSYYQSAYSAISGGKAVCAGYSRLFQYLCNQAGIPCFFAAGINTELKETLIAEDDRHAWNIVCVDGSFTVVDLTSMDTLLDGGYEDLGLFFNISDEKYQEIIPYERDPLCKTAIPAAVDVK